MPASTYLSIPVLEIVPKERLNYAIKNDYVIIGELHQRQIKWNNERTENVLEYLIHQDTQEGRANLRAFFDARKGRTEKFWMRSHKSDLTFIATGSGGAGTMIVGLTQLDAEDMRFDLASNTRHIYIPITDAYHKITDFEVEADNNRIILTIDPVLTGAVPAGSIAQYMYLVRFSDDELSIETDGRFNLPMTDVVKNDSISSSTSLKMVELQRETP